jgi:hypothetical protein
MWRIADLVKEIRGIYLEVLGGFLGAVRIFTWAHFRRVDAGSLDVPERFEPSRKPPHTVESKAAA